MTDKMASPEVEKLARQLYWSANTRLIEPGCFLVPWEQADPARKQLCRTVAEHAIAFIVARP